MRKTSWSFLGCIAGTILSGYILPGVTYPDLATAALVGVVLGAVYLLLRPIVKLVTFPLAIVTLGLLSVVIDAGFLWIVAQQFKSFRIESFGWAIVAAVIINLSRRVCKSLGR